MVSKSKEHVCVSEFCEVRVMRMACGTQQAGDRPDSRLGDRSHVRAVLCDVVTVTAFTILMTTFGATCFVLPNNHGSLAHNFPSIPCCLQPTFLALFSSLFISSATLLDDTYKNVLCQWPS